MKKNRVVFLMPLLLATVLTAGALATQAASIAEADRLSQAGQYAQAEAMYKQLVQENVGTDTALAAQRGLAMLYAKTGKEALLSQTCESLTKDFAGQKDMPSILSQIGDECRNANRFGVAVPIYQYVVDHWPKDENTIWSQGNLVCCHLCLKNEAVANAAFAKLQSDYGGQPNFRQVLCAIGDNLRWRNINAQAARQMYTLAASGDPYPEMIWARRGLAISCIRMKDFEAAGPVVESIPADLGSDPGIGQALCHIADAYRDARSHGDARRLYQYVVDHLPNDDYAMWSQVGIAVCAIDGKDDQTAQVAIEKLRADHAKRSDFAAAVCVVADNYRWREAHAKAKDLYSLTTTVGPNHGQGIWFQMGLAICSICVKDANTAEAAVTKLHSQYRNDPGLAQALYEVGTAFANAKQYDKATGEFNQVIASWPDSDYAMLSKVGLGLSQIGQGDEQAAESVFQKVLTDYANHPRLGEAMNRIALSYYERARRRQGNDQAARVDDCRRAVEMWERVIRDLPPSTMTAQAYYHSGVVYSQELGEYVKCIEYYQKVIDNWPDYEFAWHAQSSVGKYLEKLRDSGKLPESEANPKIEQAYSAFIQQYPDNDLVPIAALKLGKMKLKRELWPDAIQCLQKFLEEENGRAPQPVLRRVLGDLSHAYEQANMPDKAAEARRIVREIADPEFSRMQSRKMLHTGSSYYVQGLRHKKEGHDEEAKDHFRKAAAEWKKVITELPPSPEYSPRVYYMMAVCYGQELGEYEKSAEYFQQIVDNWPDYKYARNAQLFVARNYEFLRKAGGALNADTEAKLEGAYRAIAEKYPDSKLAPHAAFALGSTNVRRKNWGDATRYFELFLQQDQGRSPAVAASVVRHLGHAYEQMGDHKMAAEKYRMFLEISSVANPDDPRIEAVKAELERLEVAEK